MPNNFIDTRAKINPKVWPLATLAAVFFTVFAGVVHIVSQSTLSFDEYTTQIVGLWTALAIGRGLAVKDHSTEDLHPIDRFLVTFPWTWAILVFVAIVGYIGTLGDSLTFNDLGTKLAVLGGAFGLGRGIATAKRDVTTDFRGTQAQIDKHAVDQTDAFIPNPEDAVADHDYALSTSAVMDAPVEVEDATLFDPDEQETAEDASADEALKLAVANGEIAGPTADDPEPDDEPVDNSEAMDDVESAPAGPAGAWTQEGVVEGTEHAPSTRHTPDPETLS